MNLKRNLCYTYYHPDMVGDAYHARDRFQGGKDSREINDNKENGDVDSGGTDQSKDSDHQSKEETD